MRFYWGNVARCGGAFQTLPPRFASCYGLNFLFLKKFLVAVVSVLEIILDFSTIQAF